MKKIFNKSILLKSAFAFLFLLTLSTTTLEAQRVAVVDIQNVLDSYEAYTSAQAELDQIAAKWKQEIAAEYDQIKALYNKYQSEQVLLSDEAKQQREDEIMLKEKEVRDLQKQRFGPDGLLFQKRKELVQPIQDKVYKAIEDYASDRGFDFIFDKNGSTGLLYSNDKYDKTNEIKRKLGIN